MANSANFEKQAGLRSLVRLERLTEVIYGITLLQLLFSLQRPEAEQLLNASAFHNYLEEQWPMFKLYITTFFLVIVYWQSHISLFNCFRRSDSLMIWLQITGLMAVAVVPFVNDLQGLTPGDTTTQLLYSIVLGSVGVINLLLLLHGSRHKELLVSGLAENSLRNKALEASVEPLVFIVSALVSLFISPTLWAWSFILLVPGYGMLWWRGRNVSPAK